MQRLLTSIVAVFAITEMSILPAQESRPAAPTASVPTFENVNCPVMGKPSSTTLFVDTPLGRIYTCCPPCNPRIRRDPVTAHKAAYPKPIKLENKACPVTGKPISADAPRIVLQGYEFSVCSRECIVPAQENSQVVLTKAVYPGVRDVGNTVCPLSGRPVEKNAFVLIGDDLVHLSSPRCSQVAAGAPEETLRKAKALAPPAPPKASETRAVDPKAGGRGI